MRAGPEVVPKGLRAFDEHDADFFLELLPGPRRKDGLPDSIHYWKDRIEETDPEKTFRVGLIYGPSGCGKSSLVKAGLIPRLGDHVWTVLVEGTSDGMESRLLNTLRKRCPEVPTDLDLAQPISALSEGRGLPKGTKVLIVLDQFEQWLSTWRGDEEAGLVAALRHCDGGHVQAIVLVRDDFWMAVNRFDKAVRAEFRYTLNSYGVDLFDPIHAEKVLTDFGKGFVRLPEDLGMLSVEQKAFVDQAIEGLSENGKIAPVRLSLFAWMVRGKPWTPVTLKEVGGAEGVGVNFLEETFGSPHADPKYRLHQKAAQAVLKALLPRGGGRLRGESSSYSKLLSASGYSNRPEDFEDLCRILDDEIRLISLTDTHESGGQNEEETTRPHEAHYQLTHEYLVPSIRDWLTSKQTDSPQGRAELLLEELTYSWKHRSALRQETSYLPDPKEMKELLIQINPDTLQGDARTFFIKSAQSCSKHLKPLHVNFYRISRLPAY